MLLQHAAPAATGIAATAATATATAATISEWHLCLINARWLGGNVRLLEKNRAIEIPLIKKL